MNFGDQIKELREKEKWSQDELAKRAGYSNRSTIARIESGEIDVPYSKIITLAEVFGISPADFFMTDQDEEEKELRDLVRLLPDAQKEAYLTLLRSALKEEP